MKKMILLLVISIIFTLLVVPVNVLASTTDVVITNVNFFVNGNSVALEREPVAINGRILAPARTVFKDIGAKVDWYPQKGMFTIIKGSTVISMTIGHNNAIVNNVPTKLEVPPILVRGTVMAPVRFVAETLKTEVSWDGNNRAVYVGERGNPASSRGERQYVVVIDPGHGGRETGAVYGGIKEKDLNLDIAKKLQTLLKAEGITTYMTRNNDSYVGLYDRSALANRVNADILISIHNNAYTPGTTGTMTLYYPYAFKNISNRNLASIMQKEVSGYLGSRNVGTIVRADLAVLRTSKVPTALVEVGYMSNKDELKNLASNSYRQKAAEAIRNGILKALK
jgi:N-acetylmuramoyl-L-alanine amidase